MCNTQLNAAVCTVRAVPNNATSEPDPERAKVPEKWASLIAARRIIWMAIVGLFLHITDEQLPLRVADRSLPLPARIAVSRPNELGLGDGLRRPDIQRLLISANKLENTGRGVVFARG